MKTLLIVYRIITFTLLPLVALLGFADLSLILLAFANPAALLPAFAIACIVIYVFTALSFLVKGILGGRVCKASLRDWIRVNAFVSIAFGVMVVIEYLVLLANKEMQGDIVAQAMQQPGVPPGMNATDLQAALLSFLFFFFLFSVVLIIHILMTFRLLKQFRHLFQAND